MNTLPRGLSLFMDDKSAGIEVYAKYLSKYSADWAHGESRGAFGVKRHSGSSRDSDNIIKMIIEARKYLFSYRKPLPLFICYFCF